MEGNVKSAKEKSDIKKEIAEAATSVDMVFLKPLQDRPIHSPRLDTHTHTHTPVRQGGAAYRRTTQTSPLLTRRALSLGGFSCSVTVDR
jgi:hypothetical protein